MSDQLQQNSELVSALMDGALQEDEFARAMAELDGDVSVDETWDTYHLVGQALRSSDEPLRAHDPAFLVRLRQQLAKETPDLVAASSIAVRAEDQKVVQISAANDPWWRRVAGLASVAVVAVLAWQGMALVGSSRPADTTLAQLSSVPAQVATPRTLVAADGSSALMIRDPQLDALMAAHRQMGGATALQTPSGFLRNATYNEGKR